jgi:hypothetical protein
MQVGRGVNGWVSVVVKAVVWMHYSNQQDQLRRVSGIAQRV